MEAFSDLFIQSLSDFHWARLSAEGNPWGFPGLFLRWRRTKAAGIASKVLLFSAYMSPDGEQGVGDMIWVHKATWAIVVCLFGIFAVCHRYFKVSQGMVGHLHYYWGTSVSLI